MFALKIVSILILSYLIGSINSSIIISKIMLGDDIRKHGSGNAGATNALRVLGKKGGILTLLGDIIKTVIAILLSVFILKENKNLAIYLAGLGVVFGHNYPVFFHFKGGKGVAVSITSMLFADFKIGLLVLIFSLIVMAVSKFVSLGSVLGAVFCIVLSFIFKNNDIYYLIFVLIVAGFIILRHKTNIVRLIKGTENKLGSKAK